MRIDLSGRRFGRLKVVEFIDRNERSQQRWLCKCSCGGSKIIFAHNLMKPHGTRSCGCIKREQTVEINKSRATHGASRTSAYNLYRSMLNRCRCKNAGNYKYYGARGITVCRRWQGRFGFINFKADMGPRPSKQHSIERRKINLGYSPKNCYWATAEQQGQNKRNTIHFELNGERMSLRRACRLAGKHYDTTLQRIGRGWAIKDAFERPYAGVS